MFDSHSHLFQPFKEIVQPKIVKAKEKEPQWTNLAQASSSRCSSAAPLPVCCVLWKTIVRGSLDNLGSGSIMSLSDGRI